jgi:hypothetical protein
MYHLFHDQYFAYLLRWMTVPGNELLITGGALHFGR